MGEVTTRHISFGGGRARTAPLAWGQRTTWDDMRHFLPEVKAFFVLCRRLPVPGGIGLDEVAGGLRVLMERHESLRSLYRAATGPSATSVVQQVLPDGRVPLTVVDWRPGDPADFDATVEQAERAIVTRRIDHAAELPVVPCVVTREGTPALLVVGVSHVAADARAIDLLMAELAGLLDASAAGLPTPPAWTSWQPADQAAYEQSPEGMLRNAGALRRLLGQLEAAAPTMFGPPVRPAADPGHPRFVCGRLESAAIPLALRTLSRRYRTGTSAVLLAATAALTHALTGSGPCTYALVMANRGSPAAQYAITSLTQTTWATLDTSVGTFADLTAAASTALTDAARHSMYDTRAAQSLIRDLGERRGSAFDLGCRFNDMWAWTRKQPVRGLPDPAAVAAATASTTLSWPAEHATDNDRITLSVNIYGTADRLTLDLLADTYRLSKPRLHALLHAYERLLVDLLTRDIAPAEAAKLIPTPDPPN